MTQKWFCSQLGGREHYAIPRALHAIGALEGLLTDFWADPQTRRILDAFPGKTFRSLAARHHPEVPNEMVNSWNARSMGWELLARRMAREGGVNGRYRGYNNVGRRFSDVLIRHFSKLRELPENSLFFGFDTCGLEVMKYLQQRGVPCVLDQIDPGRVEMEMVQAEQEEWPGWEDQRLEIPEEFFERHHMEWEIADRVVVNSEWSRKALVQQGVQSAKIAVIPLSFELHSRSREMENGRVANRFKDSCLQFSTNRPLKVLFLGQVMLRKGIQYLARAAELLRYEPVSFDIVGPIQISDKAVGFVPNNMRFHGRATRDEIHRWYQGADVFVLPTISDGFAITQIEAMANGLPVIATPNCGEVVSDGVDGWIVPPRDPVALAAAIQQYLQEPTTLAEHQYAAVEKSKQFTLSRVASSMLELGATILI